MSDLPAPSHDSVPRDLVSVTEAARVAKVNADTLRRWAKAGRIQLWGHPGALRVSLSQVVPPATSSRRKLYYTPDGKAPAFKSGRGAAKAA